jgi:hypothetical protein
MTRDEWIAEFARQLGTEPPSIEEIRVLLDLAGKAAHGSERPAAPLACWIAARSDVPLATALEIAGRIGDPHG